MQAAVNSAGGYCGDGIVGSGEVCDKANVGCAARFPNGAATEGTCDFYCKQCVPLSDGNSSDKGGDGCTNPAGCDPVCGDGQVTGAEQCEPGQSVPSCAQLGLGAGTVDCDPVTCKLKTAGCSVDHCGDGQVTGNEQCDAGSANGTSGSCCNASCGLLSSGTECRVSAGECDLPETCNGVSAACPSDKFKAGTFTCRAAASTQCDVAEKCTGTSPACPADATKPASTVCRAAAGPCDVAETCGGAGTCPNNAFAPDTIVCRVAKAATGGAATCDVAEYCTGSSASCPANKFVAGGTECRAAAGECDVAEVCNGASDSCPANQLRSSSYTCRSEAGVCDKPEKCTGSSVSCPNDTKDPVTVACNYQPGNTATLIALASHCDGRGDECPPPPSADPCLSGEKEPGEVCRPAAPSTTGGISCDTPETCPADGGPCPQDAVRPAGGTCRFTYGGECFNSTGNACTGRVAEGGNCPISVKPAGTVCGYGVGVCAPQPHCDGISGSCPAPVFPPAGTVCNARRGECETDGVCPGPGQVPTCSAKRLLPAGTPCGSGSQCTGTSPICPSSCGNGIVNDDEDCDQGNTGPNRNGAAGSCCTATCTFKAEDTVCRPQNGVCDVAETCTGDSGACPAQEFEPNTTVCRAQNGVCDMAERCTGSSAFCPANAFAPFPTVCRAAVRAPDGTTCDTAEYCQGDSAQCPDDEFRESARVCRPSAGPCDIAENCPGDGSVCPANAFRPATTVCSSANYSCEEPSTCSGADASCPPNAVKPAGSICVGMGSTPLRCDGTNRTCPMCGDGRLDFGEECDPGIPGVFPPVPEVLGNPVQRCENFTYLEGVRTLNYEGGRLRCGNDCYFDKGLCQKKCGNGNVDLDVGEVCDPGRPGVPANMNGMQCIDLEANPHAAVPTMFNGGTLACNSTCSGYVTTACTWCGNGIREMIRPATATTAAVFEQCDGTQLGSATSCTALTFTRNVNGNNVTRNYVGGPLFCSPTCQYNESLCEACGGNNERCCRNGATCEANLACNNGNGPITNSSYCRVCGHAGELCCAPTGNPNDTPNSRCSNDATLTCSGNYCYTCGGPNQPCCDNPANRCTGSTQAAPLGCSAPAGQAGTCVAVCGGWNQPCCQSGNQCTGTMKCDPRDNRCAMTGGLGQMCRGTDPNGICLNSAYTCNTGEAPNRCIPCGSQLGQACCGSGQNATCNTSLSLVCSNGSCAQCGSAVGQACCGTGQNATCNGAPNLICDRSNANFVRCAQTNTCTASRTNYRQNTAQAGAILECLETARFASLPLCPFQLVQDSCTTAWSFQCNMLKFWRISCTATVTCMYHCPAVGTAPPPLPPSSPGSIRYPCDNRPAGHCSNALLGSSGCSTGTSCKPVSGILGTGCECIQ